MYGWNPRGAWMAVAFLAMLGICFVAYRLFLGSSICSTCRAAATLCCKPNDYHTPIFNKQIELDGGESIVTMRANPRYAGRYAIYMNVEGDRVPAVEKIYCMFGDKEIHVITSEAKIFDRFGSGFAIAHFYLKGTLLKRTLHCGAHIISSDKMAVRIRAVKLSEL